MRRPGADRRLGHPQDLLKLGGYGFVRFSLPMFPLASSYFTPLIFTLSAIAVIYTSLVALAQIDMKKLISIAHMGFVTMGTFAVTSEAVQGAGDPDVEPWMSWGCSSLCRCPRRSSAQHTRRCALAVLSSACRLIVYGIHIGGDRATRDQWVCGRVPDPCSAHSRSALECTLAATPRPRPRLTMLYLYRRGHLRHDRAGPAASRFKPARKWYSLRCYSRSLWRASIPIRGRSKVWLIISCSRWTATDAAGLRAARASLT